MAEAESDTDEGEAEGGATGEARKMRGRRPPASTALTSAMLCVCRDACASAKPPSPLAPGRPGTPALAPPLAPLGALEPVGVLMSPLATTPPKAPPTAEAEAAPTGDSEREPGCELGREPGRDPGRDAGWDEG